MQQWIREKLGWSLDIRTISTDPIIICPGEFDNVRDSARTLSPLFLIILVNLHQCPISNCMQLKDTWGRSVSIQNSLVLKLMAGQTETPLSLQELDVLACAKGHRFNSLTLSLDTLGASGAKRQWGYATKLAAVGRQQHDLSRSLGGPCLGLLTPNKSYSAACFIFGKRSCLRLICNT